MQWRVWRLLNVYDPMSTTNKSGSKHIALNRFLQEGLGLIQANPFKIKHLHFVPNRRSLDLLFGCLQLARQG